MKLNGIVDSSYPYFQTISETAAQWMHETQEPKNGGANTEGVISNEINFIGYIWKTGIFVRIKGSVKGLKINSLLLKTILLST